VLAQSALFVAIFFGYQCSLGTDLGLLNKLLSTPASRSSIILGKALSAGVRGIFQAVAVIILALILRVHLIMTALSPRSLRSSSSCWVCVSRAWVWHSVFSQDQGKDDGHRPGNYHAAFLREQRISVAIMRHGLTYRHNQPSDIVVVLWETCLQREPVIATAWFPGNNRCTILFWCSPAWD